MTESFRAPQSEFALTFDLLEATALDPVKGFVMLEQREDPEVRPATQPEVDFVADSKGPRYLIIERNVALSQPGQEPAGYMQWKTGEGAEDALPRPLDEATRAIWERSGRPLERGGAGAFVKLAMSFLEHANTPEELAHVLGAAFAQTTHFKGRDRQRLTSALRLGIVKSLRFVNEPSVQIVPETVRQTIATLDVDDAAWARKTVREQFANALATARQASHRTQYDVGATYSEQIKQGIQMYEESELLDDSFWVQTGIKDVQKVLDLPEFLTMLRDRLVGPEGTRIVSHLRDRRNEGRTYLTAVLTHYTQDFQRHRKNALLAFNRTHSDSLLDGETIDLFALVYEANRLTATHNKRVDQSGGNQDMKYSILSNGPRFYAEAFLRVAAIMRDPQQDLRVRAEQLEQDIMHAQIISTIFTKHDHPDQPALANLALRFPDISPRQLRAAQDMARRGIALREAVEQVTQP